MFDLIVKRSYFDLACEAVGKVSKNSASNVAYMIGDTYPGEYHADRLDTSGKDLLKFAVETKAALMQVDDFLTVNWVSPKTGDYYAALNEVISWNIVIERDPAVNPQAKIAADNDAALRKLSAALGNPNLEWDEKTSIADALVTFALEKLVVVTKDNADLTEDRRTAHSG